MKHIQLTKRDGTCEPGWERRGDMCIKKDAPKSEVEAELKEFRKSEQEPKKREMVLNKRIGVTYPKTR